MKLINIIIVYGHNPLDIFYYNTRVPENTTIHQAIKKTSLPDIYKDVDFFQLAYAIYGRKEKADYILKEGDRLEILRPRINDPRSKMLSDKNKKS